LSPRDESSDDFVVDSNYFHPDAAGSGSDANLTSVRTSVIRNNIFGH
jgi:hypothetical protein